MRERQGVGIGSFCQEGLGLYKKNPTGVRKGFYLPTHLTNLISHIEPIWCRRRKVGPCIESKSQWNDSESYRGRKISTTRADLIVTRGPCLTKLPLSYSYMGLLNTSSIGYRDLTYKSRETWHLNNEPWTIILTVSLSQS